MRMNIRGYAGIVLLASLCFSPALLAEKNVQALKVDKNQVKSWNRFSEQLYQLHKAIIKHKTIRTETEQGGYANQPNLYTETRYYEKTHNRLVSRIQRMNHNPELIHLIELFIYDQDGNVSRDYLSAYLPFHRNAPIQTLINLHSHENGLHAFRQFDASGEHIYEQCKGRYAGKPVLISLEEDDLVQGIGRKSGVLKSAVYHACFKAIPMDAHPYLDPTNEIALLEEKQQVTTTADDEDIQKKIERISKKLEKDSNNVALLIKRGNLYFQAHEFDFAIADFTDAIELNDKADEAYFGRGLALGRNGQIREGIKDLSLYIRRHPESSLALTKRGVRYLWISKEQLAQKDFERAIQLNPNNAEAHDDLGVILARQGRNMEALRHFTMTVTIDPTYQKGHHNQAMVYYILGQDMLAYQAVKHALKLSPNARDSMMLQSLILKKLGRIQEAKKVREEAEFLPEGNWSEHIPVH